MDYRKTEEIMAWVAEHERGSFSVNGDRRLTRILSERIDVLNSRRFLGKSMFYDNRNMYCTAGERKDDGFCIPAGAVIYGPYHEFPAGKYRAEFHLEGDVGNFTLSVESLAQGVILKREFLMASSTVHTLYYELPQRTQELELKVHHNGTDTLRFMGVEVFLCKDMLSTEEEQELFRHECESLAVFGSEQLAAESALESMRSTAPCTLPPNTRLRFFKRVIRKLMKPYISFQLLFNHAAAAQSERLTTQMGRVKELLEGIFARYERVDKRLQTIEQREAELSLLGRTFERREAEQRAQRKQLDELRKQLDELRKQNSDMQRQVDCDMQRLEAQRLADAQKLAERHHALVQELEAREVGDSEARREIGHLWNKVAEFDGNFRNSWQHDQSTNNNLNSLWTEQSNLRRELFYELDHRLRGRVCEDTVTEPVIKASAREKIEGSGVICLNLGSGNLAVEGYLSVDARDLASVDVVADVGNLPFGAGEVDEIYSAHLIEHFTLLRLENELLPHWFSRLKEGGVFRIVFPDLPAMIAAYNAGEMSFDELGEVIMGGQDYALDYHYAVHSVERVTALLNKAGFREIRVLAEGRKNGLCRESEITAVK